MSDLSIAVVSHFLNSIRLETQLAFAFLHDHSAPGCNAEVPPHASWQGDLAAPRQGQHFAKWLLACSIGRAIAHCNQTLQPLIEAGAVEALLRRGREAIRYLMTGSVRLAL